MLSGLFVLFLFTEPFCELVDLGTTYNLRLSYYCTTYGYFVRLDD